MFAFALFLIQIVFVCAWIGFTLCFVLCFYMGCIVKLQGLGLELGVDLTFAWDNNNNDNNKNDKNPRLNIWKGTALGDKEQGVGIRGKT